MAPDGCQIQCKIQSVTEIPGGQNWDPHPGQKEGSDGARNAFVHSFLLLPWAKVFPSMLSLTIFFKLVSLQRNLIHPYDFKYAHKLQEVGKIHLQINAW